MEASPTALAAASVSTTASVETDASRGETGASRAETGASGSTTAVSVNAARVSNVRSGTPTSVFGAVDGFSDARFDSSGLEVTDADAVSDAAEDAAAEDAAAGAAFGAVADVGRVDKNPVDDDPTVADNVE